MCAGAVLRSRRVCFVSVERKTILNADNVWHFVHRAYCLNELWYERSWQLIRSKGWQISKALCRIQKKLSKRRRMQRACARKNRARMRVRSSSLQKIELVKYKGASSREVSR